MEDKIKIIVDSLSSMTQKLIKMRTDFEILISDVILKEV